MFSSLSSPFRETETEWGQGWGKWRVGDKAGLVEGHRASQRGSTRLQCQDGTLSLCPTPLGPFGETVSVGMPEAGWVRLLCCGLSCCSDEFPRPWACGWARPGQGGCLPDIFSLWMQKGRQPGKLGAPTCLLAQQASARRRPEGPIKQAPALWPQPGQAPRTTGTGMVGRGAGWRTGQRLRPGGPGPVDASQLMRGLGQHFSSGFCGHEQGGGYKGLRDLTFASSNPSYVTLRCLVSFPRKM